MTENEAIERIKYRIDTATDTAGRGVDGNAYEDMEMAIKALEENQKYRQICSPEELEQAMPALKKFVDDLFSKFSESGFAETFMELSGKALEEFKEYRAIGTVKEFKKLKESNMTALELAMIDAEKDILEKYQEIGTVDQLREATEYRNPVTPKLESQYYICPRCGSSKNTMLRSKFCSECGQAFKWKEEE